VARVEKEAVVEMANLRKIGPSISLVTALVDAYGGMPGDGDIKHVKEHPQYLVLERALLIH
jgi:hypothetical protein